MSGTELKVRKEDPIGATISLLKRVAEEGLVPFSADGAPSELRQQCLKQIAELRQHKIDKIEVSIYASEDILHGTVASDAASDYAFYIYRNDTLIHQRWYSSDNTVAFDVGGVPGAYRITAFVRGGGEEIFSKLSSEVFVYGDRLNVAEINTETLADDRPLSVKSGHHDFHCLFSRGEQNRLFVLLTAAIRRGHHPIPSFNRWKWRKRFPGHVLCIADPTLAASSTLEIAWYLGDQKRDATTDMARLVGRVAGLLGVPASGIVSYGSSAGGFAAMALASRLNGSMAVAINPQTDATKYKPRQVKAMADHCFPGRDIEAIRTEYASRLDMATALAPTTSRVLLVQNTKDEEHWEPHFLPFSRQFGIPAETGRSENRRHASIIYSHDSGHASEPPEVFDAIIQYVLAET